MVHCEFLCYTKFKLRYNPVRDPMGKQPVDRAESNPPTDFADSKLPERKLATQVPTFPFMPACTSRIGRRLNRGGSRIRLDTASLQRSNRLMSGSDDVVRVLI